MASCESPAGESAGAGRGRLTALDAFRGLAMVGMILANNPGSWSHVYPPLRHAPWHGCTPTDLVFPFFLFAVGAAIPLALERRRAGGRGESAILRQALRRCLILVGLGLFLSAFPVFEWKDGWAIRDGAWRELRLPGVLQRIGVCYLGAVWIFLKAPSRYWGWGVAVGLIFYWLALAGIPVPGQVEGPWADPAATLPAWVDRWILGPDHLWSGTQGRWDPEGLLSTLPAVGTCMLGVITGTLLRRPDLGAEAKAARLLVRGVIALVGGYAWSLVFPLNKGLWTSSFVLFTAGWAQCLLGVFYWQADVAGRSWLFRPLVVFGRNALTVFVGSALVGRILNLIRLDGGLTLKTWLFETLYLSWIPPMPASLCFALTWVIGWYGVLYAMDRRGWIWKV